LNQPREMTGISRHFVEKKGIQETSYENVSPAREEVQKKS